jgi:CBS domain-containing protein
MKTADLMSRHVITLSPGSSVWHATRIMRDHAVSGLPVVDDLGNLVGMLTEGDLLRRVEPDSLEEASARWKHLAAPEGLARDFVMSHSWRVADLMTSPVVTVAENTSLHDVAELLLTRGIKRMPVMRNGRMVGIISRADLLVCIANEPQHPIPNGDDAIRLSVQTRLRDVERVLSVQPKVTVEAGVVHLWGELGSQAERDTARVVVEGVPGIAGFEDHTIVVRC